MRKKLFLLPLVLLLLGAGPHAPIGPRKALSPRPGESVDIRYFEPGKLTGPGGKEFPVSVVTEPYAQRLFQQMAEQTHIPFQYPEDGCYARAHEMSRLLGKMGIQTGKVFVEGDLRVVTPHSPQGYVNWWYHVAPVLLVRIGKVDHVYVIDPSIAKKAIPVSEWVAMQTGHRGGHSKETYQTKPFVYQPYNKNEDLHDYKAEDIQAMKSTLESYLAVQKARQQPEKKK